MNAGQVAALIAAVFFAVGVCVAAYALVKLARLLTEGTRFLAGMRDRTDTLIEQAQAAVDRTNEQLNRTDAVTANMTEVSANVAELTEHVSVLAGLARALTAGPVGKASAVAYGVRHALDLRRPGGSSAVTPSAAVPAQRGVPELRAASAAVPAQRGVPELRAGSAAVSAQRGVPELRAGSAAGRRPSPGIGSSAARQAGSLAARQAGTVAASLAARGARSAGRSLAARAIGRSAR